MKVLVIGSGPIVIGQAAEFDYAGTQACKALREEGHSVVLVNSNPATIMTDPGVADFLYIEPLTVEFLERVIARERPEALLPTLGGQTGLNLATQLQDAGILEKYDVRVLGTPLSAIKMAEDRESFRDLMREIQEPVPESWIVTNEDELLAALDVVPYPCIIRPAYTLGGTGGGIAETREELWETGRKGLKLSMRSQIMVERSLLGWKEIEYEVMRDAKGTVITVCNMENFDPMGVHTGDSIVVAPSQTMSDQEYHMMRTAALKIITALGIEGGCNVQMALNPDSFDYYIIEVNPRVSRSSALASKATGYPIARVAAKIAVGLTLDEIENKVTGTTKACFEPALDYCVVKIPRWPFDKFPDADRTLFTQMKATGEVMAIDRSFEAAFLKAVRGLELKRRDLRWEVPGPVPVGGASRPPLPRRLGIRDDVPLVKRESDDLPHWRQEGATYAVTFRAADALPAEALEDLRLARREISALQERGVTLDPELVRQAEEVFDERVDRWLDAGSGACPLRDPAQARLVAEALAHFDGERYRLHAYAVMPNHVHAVVEPLGDHELSEILHSWKSFTGRRLRPGGEFWMAESYDRIIRDEAEFDRQVAYVQANPAKGGLGEWSFVSRWASFEGGAGRPPHDDDAALAARVKQPTDDRLWAIAEALRRGWGVNRVNKLCRVDKWFLRKIERILDVEHALVDARNAHRVEGLAELVHRAFLIGYPSPTIRDLLQDAGGPEGYREAVAREIEAQKVQPVFKMVDTCAGEFESRTPYYYGTFEQEDDAPHRAREA